MKHFYCILSLVVFAGSVAQAAPARTFNSTQTFNSRGTSGAAANWFYEVQPLPAQVQPLKAPTIEEKQNAAVQPKASAVEKDVKAIPAPRPPQRKTIKDTRKVDVTASANDTQKILLKPELAPKAETKTSTSRAPYKKSLLDQTEFDPHYRDKSLTTGNDVLQRAPPPKPRRHGFRDWP